ncbi:MAG: hypothetical protein JXA58_06510, partial [Dehalococcoidia bacterium]|nr:hypothetical protein [Dehalococcoidia bacterium]
GLLLANVMSPRIWNWRHDPWFEGIVKMKPYRRISRVKQYIMDHYIFNLDLDTWGLTTKQREMDRFSRFIDHETLAQSNALFGYEGDKYYFSIDIRTHFGLDKYDGDVIPYWKTETVEAMDAFKYRPQYGTGAGECVSLAALYAAALFIVARIPLADIFLLATPLHSQNFVDVDDGILTNNRRLLTKAMWFNGTALSAQARRALENERVTIVAHETGFIHTVYERATIDPGAYARFSEKLRAFLQTSISEEIVVNFLRHHRDIQNCFQVRWPVHGIEHYIAAEHAFSYEHGSSYRLSDSTRSKLLDEIDEEEFKATPLPGRIVLNDFESYIRENHIDCSRPEDLRRLKQALGHSCARATMAIDALTAFCHVEPRLPNPSTKEFSTEGEPLGLRPDMQRDEVIARLEGLRERHPVADLAFYAYRDLNRTEPWPFLLAALERNPVSIHGARDMSDAEVIGHVTELPDESIYDEKGRLAQPDEVWNYGRGDGVEKAILLANLLRERRPGTRLELAVEPERAHLSIDGEVFAFASAKGLQSSVWRLSEWLGADP